MVSCQTLRKKPLLPNRDKTRRQKCLKQSGFSNSPFAVERLRQGDRLSAYLFIIPLEVLYVNIGNTNDNRGITVDNDEMKVCLFADDLTANKLSSTYRRLWNFLWAEG